VGRYIYLDLERAVETVTVSGELEHVAEFVISDSRPIVIIARDFSPRFVCLGISATDSH